MNAAAALPVPSRSRFLVASAALALLLAVAPAAHAQTWAEVGDAGSLVSTAQVTLGGEALATITGSLASPEDVDVYCVMTDQLPRGLGLPVIQLVCLAHTSPGVWLFDASGVGVGTE